MIELENISFAYRGKAVIQDIQLEIAPGHFHSLIGPNGSGKTTLLDLLSGYLKPDSGQVRINHADIHQQPKQEIARTISIVAQNDSINFPYSVEDVLLMGRHPYIPRFSSPSSADYEIMDAVAHKCGISHLRKNKITELSGGELQRCLFARALCQDTPILLLDEAFSNMDIRHTLQLLKLIKMAVLKENKTVISVFHDLNLACTWSDTILMLNKGRIAAVGSPDTVITPHHIQQVFGVTVLSDINPHTGKRQVHYPNI